jgi:hypothetical protein
MKFDYQFVEYAPKQIRIEIHQTKLNQELQTIAQINTEDWEKVPEFLQGLTIYHFYQWLNGYGFQVDPVATEYLDTSLDKSPRFCVITPSNNPDRF